MWKLQMHHCRSPVRNERQSEDLRLINYYLKKTLFYEALSLRIDFFLMIPVQKKFFSFKVDLTKVYL